MRRRPRWPVPIKERMNGLKLEVREGAPDENGDFQ